jgi:phosphopantothenoylcysteine decarboxylase/phosphopantothenate--cysteine ligase
MRLEGKKILLIIGGGIAAFKAQDFVRAIRKEGGSVTVILTKAGSEFVTPLSLAALSGNKVYQDLFSLTDETDMGHIELSRSADLVVVAPATADLMAKAANGLANDLASTTLLATDKPVLMAPAMNVRMWLHPATQRNLAVLKGDGIGIIGPDEGPMACGEFGPGRMAEPANLLEAVIAHFAARTEKTAKPLSGRHVLITSGPTHEPIDPVRYIANRSSGKQGHAIAEAAARAGARVTLISGPVTLPDPAGVHVIHVEEARAMLHAVQTALPADIAIFCAAVADWGVKSAGEQKYKKDISGPPRLELAENPDILATIAQAKTDRPALVIGFAAETEQVVAYAQAKLKKKQCDWIVANDVSPATGVMGGDQNTVHLIRGDHVSAWPLMDKKAVAEALVQEIALAFANTSV